MVAAASGSAFASSGGITVTRLAAGKYNVDFGRDMTHCALTGNVVATGNRNPNLVPPVPAGFVTFTGSGDNGGPLANVVYVGTYDAGGTLADLKRTT